MLKKSSKFPLFLAFFVICMAIPFGHTFSTDGFDPYQTLGLEMGATQNEIKQAYKKLAMEWFVENNWMGRIFGMDLQASRQEQKSGSPRTIHGSESGIWGILEMEMETFLIGIFGIGAA
jgi:hypothetical protein